MVSLNGGVMKPTRNVSRVLRRLGVALRRCCGWEETGEANGEDGFWRDKDGNVVQSSGGTGGLIEVVKGMMNAVARVRGKGGF